MSPKVENRTLVNRGKIRLLALGSWLFDSRKTYLRSRGRLRSTINHSLDDLGREEIMRRDAALPRLTIATLKILKD